MVYRLLASLIYRHPVVIVACWAAFFIFFGSFSAELPSVVRGPGLNADGSASRVQQIANEHLLIPEDPVFVLFERHNNTTSAEFLSVIEANLNAIRNLDGVNRIISPLQHRDLLRDQAAYAVLALNKPSYQQAPLVKQIRSLLSETAGVKIQLTGASIIQDDVNRASMHDFKMAERVGIPAAFIILLLTFGGILYAFIPVITGLLTVTSAMGMMVIISRWYDLDQSNFILNVIPMTGLALSLDFAFIITNRFREELGRGSTASALRATMSTSGRAVFFSAACVICGLIAVGFIPMPMFESASLSSMVVVALAVVINLSLVPALLVLLAPVLQNKARRNMFPSLSFRLWSTWADKVMRRPIRMLAGAGFIVILLLIPALHMTTAVPDADSLPPNTESRQADAAIRQYFHHEGTSEILVVVQAMGKFLTIQEKEKANSWLGKIKDDPEVIRVSPLRNMEYVRGLSPSIAMFQVLLRGNPDSARVNEWLRAAEKSAETSGANILLGGEAKSRQEVKDAITEVLPLMLGFIIFSNLIVLFAAFRSILIPIKALVMNMLSIGASFGILVLVFQTCLTGIPSEDIAIMVPVFVFGLVFGVSMDYGVFLLSRMSEAFDDTGNSDHAIRHGMAVTGKLITSAAAILIAVTLPFAFGEVEGVRQLGAGIAAAVFIDATLIRLLLVPSLMKLLGNVNWWIPRWLRSS
ncbi:MMPL family transporter [Paenibacillus sp. HJL G12]|uniref:MMPL family transporter n=1 Tax=Paenibacillus dendrobii TaxID=2691084 RepID=A0A7X3IEI9_9BACL|nr:MMPL family transporter [Paenibacillus dendrobii]MWV42400.1 MMPL family transporter [Paenibacillus dendrobii]